MSSPLPREAAQDAPPTQPPGLFDVGTLNEATAGASTGNFLDQTFPTGTPFKDLTFT
jgi:hypothetical protein